MSPTEVMVERQYLRVKRRRTEAPPSTLRLEGLQQVPSARPSNQAITSFASLSLASDIYEEPNPATNSSRKRSTTALLRRVTHVSDDSGSSACSYRVVDAVLAADEEELEFNGNKRRRLTLVESKTVQDSKALKQLLNSNHHSKKKMKKKIPIRVFNPVERMVDESMKKVYQGDITPRHHIDFVSKNESLSSRRLHWLAWSNAEMGNLLHACALWNDPELAVELLQIVGPKQLGTQTDGDGQTPYQVAETTGHTSVMEVLEAFGLDASNYVYDLYCLDEQVDHEEPFDENQKMAALAEHDWSCELQGGYGYWDEQGRLMLEALDQSLLEHDLLDNEGEGDDEDSNDEGYAGNDYPDENQVYWGTEEEEDEDKDEEEYDNTFRSHKSPYDYAEDDFDAAYGIYGQE